MGFQDVSITSDMADANSLFALLDPIRLQMHEPRWGQAARAQRSVDLLLKWGVKKIGRAWALPQEGHISFLAPIRDIHGQPFAALKESDAVAPQAVGQLMWKFDVAATVETSGGPVVLDHRLSGPADLKQWQSRFDGSPVKFMALKYFEAPVYGDFGSCYKPGANEEHGACNPLLAKAELGLLRVLQRDPEYAPPQFRPAFVPASNHRLFVKNC
jgi:hypothetical protein